MDDNNRNTSAVDAKPRHSVGEFSRRMAELREQEAALDDLDALLDFVTDAPPLFAPPDEQANLDEAADWLLRR